MFLTNQQKYIQKRERLIKVAEIFANTIAGKKPTLKVAGKKADPDLLEWYTKWNFAFHSHMSRLCKKHGITKC